MQTLQDELDADHPGVFRILGVNEVGFEAGNDDMCDGRDLPWLQDVEGVDVWGALWDVTYRDVIVLDDSNVVYGVYNVTDHNLSDPVEYAGLRQMMREAAGLAEPSGDDDDSAE